MCVCVCVCACVCVCVAPCVTDPVSFLLCLDHPVHAPSVDGNPFHCDIPDDLGCHIKVTSGLNFDHGREKGFHSG